MLQYYSANLYHIITMHKREKYHLGLLHLRRLYVTPTPQVLEQDCHAPQGPHPPGLINLGVCLASSNVVQFSLKQIYKNRQYLTKT